MSAADGPVLEARSLVKDFPLRGGVLRVGPRRRWLRAVDGVSLALAPARVLALVGESGSGKSTMARLLAFLERPDSGQVLLDGKRAEPRRARAHRRHVQVVFQDPFASLNPVHTVRHHLARPLLIHGQASRRQVVAAAAEMLRRVSLEPVDQFLDKLPHQLSGGQRQRVAIAAALAAGPRVLLADEPVSMLDVSIRLGILNLLQGLAAEQRLAVLYITHDIASARYFADTVGVMYAGRMVELGPAEELVARPGHPYTRLLIAAAPEGRSGAPEPLPQRAGGEMGRKDKGCPFASRCPLVMARCREQRPPELALGPGRWAACWLHERGGTNGLRGPGDPSQAVVLTGGL